jgi:hypothetical protein
MIQQIDEMLLHAERIRRNDLKGESCSNQKTRREEFPDFIQYFPNTGAVRNVLHKHYISLLLVTTSSLTKLMLHTIMTFCACASM